eukprot:3481483-Amphidinium_carterae.1
MTGWQRLALGKWMLERKQGEYALPTVIENERQAQSAPRAHSAMSSTTGAACSNINSVHPELNTSRETARDGVSAAARRRGRTTRGFISRTNGYYQAFALIGHATVYASYRKELADAIADNILLVDIKQKAVDIGTGNLYKDRLPRAIVAVTREHGFDDRLLR